MDNSLYLSSALYDIAIIKDYAIEGKMNAIESYVQLKTIEKVIKEAIDKVQELAIDEGLKYNQKSFVAYGATVEMKSAPSRWDYSKCMQVQHLSAKLKTMQELSQLAVNSKMYDEDGLQIEPATKIEGKQSIAITLGKNK
jgi:hypothetical protein